MTRRRLQAGRRVALTFLVAALAVSHLPGRSLHAQCTTRVWDTSRPPEHPSWLLPFIPVGTQPAFAAQLNSSDWLITYQLQHEPGDKGAFYTGFVVVRSGEVVRNVSLMSVGAWKRMGKKLGYTNMAALNVYAAQVCQDKQLLAAVGFQVCCTASSGILYFIVTPEPDFYRITPLPMVGGGKLEISSTFPVQLRLWGEEGDGTCDACLQHFNVSEYSVVAGKPTPGQHNTTSQQFKPGDFDADRIVIFPAGD
ncbi:MAG TPA: hypothetical protein VME86_04435 [Acidobacteriaceae bacterium]|nr:hypothetical protein [Acidobacteriaceae bacterium]